MSDTAIIILSLPLAFVFGFAWHMGACLAAEVFDWLWKLGQRVAWRRM